MIKTRFFAVIALLGLFVMVFGACSEPTPSPTPTEITIQNAIEARDAALAYLQAASVDIPGSDADWQETDTTTPGLIGGVKKQYTTAEWTIGMAYNVVRPDQVIYHIVILSLKHGLHWEGQVKADGTIDEISPLKEMSEGGSEKVAENFVRNSPTFTFDGMEDTLKLVDTLRARCPYCWVFVFEFDSAHAGYGDRMGQMLAQVITNHQASVSIEKLQVTSAMMDDKWDMILQQEVTPMRPPIAGVPAAPNDSIVTGKVIDVINVSGDFPWEFIIEVQIAEDVPGYGNAIKQRVGEQISVQTQEDISNLKKGQIIKANVKLEGDERTRFYYATNIKTAPTTTGSLESTSWILESYGERDNFKLVLDGTGITVIFNSTEGQVKGSAGCNSYFGGYEVSNNNLSILQIGNTEMYCMEPEGVMEQEEQYLKALRAAESYKVQDGKLQINCGAQILTYVSG